MRTISLAAGMIAVGVLAALPFRRSENPIEPQTPFGVATGPLNRQLQCELIDGVQQWPNRPGFDSSIPWQPQPTTFDSSPHAFEMPTMPEAFPSDAIEVPIPAPIRDRYDAAVNVRESVGERGLLMPMVAQIEDRFVYTPAPTPPNPARAGRVQPASVIRNEVAGDKPSSGRVYIREPQ